MADARFDQLVRAWLATLASPNTRAAYQRDLEVYGSWARGASIRPSRATPTDLDAFRDHCLASGSGASTVNRRLAAVTSFYRHAAPVWGPNPAERTDRTVVEGRRAAAQLSQAAADAVWDAANRVGGRTAVIVGLVLLDGFKTKDVLLLDIEDVRVSRSEVSVGGVPLHPLTAAALRRHLRGRRTGPLLTGESVGRDPTRLSRFGVDYLVKRVGVEAHLHDPLTVSSLRATARGAPM